MKKRQYAKVSSWPLVRTVDTLNAAGFEAFKVDVDSVRRSAELWEGRGMPHAILQSDHGDAEILVGVLVDVFARSPKVIDPVLVLGGGIAGAFADADLADVLSEASTPAARRNEHAGLAKFLLARLPVSRPGLPSRPTTIDDEHGLLLGWQGLAQRYAEQTTAELLDSVH